jgi:hypothetical protein
MAWPGRQRICAETKTSVEVNATAGIAGFLLPPPDKIAFAAFPICALSSPAQLSGLPR